MTPKQIRDAQRKHYEHEMALRAIARNEAKMAARRDERRLLGIGIGEAGWASARNIPGTFGYVRDW
jgi:hypothetical protein